MKKIFILLLLILPLFAFAQESLYVAPEKNEDKEIVYSFSMSESGVIWQSIYDTDLSKGEIENYFLDQTFMKLDRKTESAMIFTINRLSSKVKMSAPMYLRYPLSGSVRVQTRDNTYRVTVSNIIFSSSTDWDFGGVSTNSNDQTTLEAYSYNTRRNKFKSIFIGSGAEILDSIFGDLFQIKAIPSDDW